jgi:hypothetical protein
LVWPWLASTSPVKRAGGRKALASRDKELRVKGMRESSTIDVDEHGRWRSQVVVGVFLSKRRKNILGSDDSQGGRLDAITDHGISSPGKLVYYPPYCMNT